MVQYFHCTFTAEGLGSKPGWGTKLHPYSLKEKKKTSEDVSYGSKK